MNKRYRMTKLSEAHKNQLPENRALLDPAHAECLIDRQNIMREIHARIHPGLTTTQHRKFFVMLDPWLMALYRRGRIDMLSTLDESSKANRSQFGSEDTENEN